MVCYFEYFSFKKNITDFFKDILNAFQWIVWNFILEIIF